MRRCKLNLNDLDEIHVVTTVDHLIWKSMFCWFWKGAGERYGNYKGEGAHRYVYEEVFGPIPEGLVLDHYVCDNPKCVNPLHLKPVTQRENVLRSDTAIAAINARKTECKNGHTFTASNTYMYRGRRICKKCAAQRNRDARSKQRRS